MWHILSCLFNDTAKVIDINEVSRPTTRKNKMNLFLHSEQPVGMVSIDNYVQQTRDLFFLRNFSMLTKKSASWN